MGIVVPDIRCDDSPSKAHLYVGRTCISGGQIFECVHCHRVRWYPTVINDAVEFSNKIRIYGLDGAYQRVLDRHPQARDLIVKIQDIHLLRKSLRPGQLAGVVAAIITDKDYPYDVEIEEEEML